MKSFSIQSIPLLPLFIGLVAGIIFERYVGGGVATLFSLLILTAFALWVRRRFLLMLVAGIAFGWVVSYTARPYNFPQLPSSQTYYEGTVTQVISMPQSTRLLVCVDRRVVSSYTPDSAKFVTQKIREFRAYVGIPTQVSIPFEGDRVVFTGRFSYPRTPEYLPGEYDGPDYNYLNAISLDCFSKPEQFKCVGTDNSLYYRLIRMREEIGDRISGSGLSPETSDFIRMILLGSRNEDIGTIRDDFARVGVAHVMALSGLHVGILAFVFALLFYPLSFFGHYKLRWGLTMIVLWVYAVMTGLSPSVVRAVIMASVVIGSIILDRPRSSLNSLLFAAIVILIFSPYSLYRPGFQLSFLATAAIIVASFRLTPVLPVSRPFRWILSAVTVTVAATLATLPLSALIFHRVPLYFLPANLLVGFLLPVLLVGGLWMAVFGGGGVVAEVLDFVYNLQLKAVGWLNDIPAACVDGVYFSPWLLLPAFIGVICLFALLFVSSWRKRLILLAGAATAFTFCFLFPSKHYPDNELFIPGNLHSTRLIHHHGDTVTVLNISKAYPHPADSVGFIDRYADFLGCRNVSFVEFRHVPPQQISVEPYNVGDIRIGIAGRNAVDISESDSIHYDYLLVVNSFYGDVVELARQSAADTILLSADISKRRHLRYADELNDASIPYRSLRQGYFSLTPDKVCRP